MNTRVPPRIYCIVETQAPVAAVFQRGPSHWSRVGRWDLAERRYEPGAWLGGRSFHGNWSKAMAQGAVGKK